MAPALEDLLIYELHIGTFTPEGTFAAAAERLAGLAELGVTAVEIMPVAEFPGERGWGYDGVYISAAQSSYGGPLELAAFVAAAHRHGLAVILDVVYNHLGASGAAAMEAFGPVLHRQVRDAMGQGDELRRRRLRPGARMGDARAPRAGCGTSGSTGCGWTPSTPSSTRAPSTSSPPWPGASTPSIRATT